jgi:hypothetical protein
MHGGISKEWFAPNWIVPMSRRPALVALLTSAAASSERLLDFCRGATGSCGTPSRRQLLAKAAMAASRVAAYPWVGLGPSWCGKISVHIHGDLTGAALALKCGRQQRPPRARSGPGPWPPPEAAAPPQRRPPMRDRSVPFRLKLVSAASVEELEMQK